MRVFPGEVRNFQDVAPALPHKNSLLIETFAGGNTFVLGPGYEVIEAGQVPQALPGQAHDGFPLASSNAAAAPLPLSTSATPQHVIGVSSQLPSTVLSSSQGASFAESAPRTSATPSGSSLVQVRSSL
jgi:hypothetical protein